MEGIGDRRPIRVNPRTFAALCVKKLGNANFHGCPQIGADKGMLGNQIACHENSCYSNL